MALTCDFFYISVYDDSSTYTCGKRPPCSINIHSSTDNTATLTTEYSCSPTQQTSSGVITLTATKTDAPIFKVDVSNPVQPVRRPVVLNQKYQGARSLKPHLILQKICTFAPRYEARHCPTRHFHKKT